MIDYYVLFQTTRQLLKVQLIHSRVKFWSKNNVILTVNSGENFFNFFTTKSPHLLALNDFMGLNFCMISVKLIGVNFSSFFHSGLRTSSGEVNEIAQMLSEINKKQHKKDSRLVLKNAGSLNNGYLFFK